MTDRQKAIRRTLNDIDVLIKRFENSQTPDMSEAAYNVLCREADRLEAELAR